MAPLPEWNTPRVFYTYQNNVGKHELMVRLATSGVLSDADTFVGSFLSAVGALFPESTIVKVEQSAEGSNIRHAVASDRIGDIFGSGLASKTQNAVEFNFTGKSTSGRRVRLGLFGYLLGLSDYRLLPTEEAAVGSALTVLAAATGAPAAIDGDLAIWNQYANVKANDHWVKKARA